MPYRRIVAGVDFGEASLAATRWVAQHLAPEAELVLVHVVSEPRVPCFLDGHTRSSSARTRDAVPSLHGALRGLANMLGAHRTRVELFAGAPADALALVAAELEADVICVGRGAGRRGSARFGATTPQRLLARTRLPVLVMPPASASPPTRVLVGADDRRGGDVIVRAASSVAAACDARLDVVHVLEPEVVGLADGAGASVPVADAIVMRRAELLGAVTTDALDRLRLSKLARGWLGEVVERDVAPSVRATPRVCEGDAGQELVAHAQRHAVDLLVVGRGGDATHADVPPGALGIGSTTRFVMWAAPCPVLVCAPDRRAPQQLLLHRERSGARSVRRGPLGRAAREDAGDHVPDDAA